MQWEGNMTRKEEKKKTQTGRDQVGSFGCKLQKLTLTNLGGKKDLLQNRSSQSQVRILGMCESGWGGSGREDNRLANSPEPQ